ncbi:YdeI family protein [Daejeonella sp.]|uniref:YdeI/OmpD-associated family protein n=1 Tax=Daejeonella sp. TaxID=2805397 RepID=UPI0027312EAE|nr:YdeI/OmpD-associated family protein [Daejeonella sp.]MDP2414905.1 YdeI/OmpD-associated family protein [Daejeonella sp.]
MSGHEMDTLCPANRSDWRKWLLENHRSRQSVWLIYYKIKSGKPTLKYDDAVDEALCFGWIDSKAKPIDDERFMQFFSKRKAKSVWSKINKEKVGRLIAEGLMTDAGLECIEIAKQNGFWSILDTAESLEIPDDLEVGFEKTPDSKDYFLGLSRSDKRNILQWLVLAKRMETRQKRIFEIVELAGQRQKPKQFR